MARRTIVTVVGLSALSCTGMALTPAPDPLPFDDPPPLGKEVPYDKQDKFTKTLNKRVDNETIYRGNGRCWYHGDFDEPPSSWEPPPHVAVECPVGMLGHKWEACKGGTVRITDKGNACLCSMDGNPPPPDRLMKCPEE